MNLYAAPTAGGDGFISADLSADPATKSGYTVTLTPRARDGHHAARSATAPRRRPPSRRRRAQQRRQFRHAIFFTNGGTIYQTPRPSRRCRPGPRRRDANPVDSLFRVAFAALSSPEPSPLHLTHRPDAPYHRSSATLRWRVMTRRTAIALLVFCVLGPSCPACRRTSTTGCSPSPLHGLLLDQRHVELRDGVRKPVRHVRGVPVAIAGVIWFVGATMLVAASWRGATIRSRTCAGKAAKTRGARPAPRDRFTDYAPSTCSRGRSSAWRS